MKSSVALIALALSPTHVGPPGPSSVSPSTIERAQFPDAPDDGMELDQYAIFIEKPDIKALFNQVFSRPESVSLFLRSQFSPKNSIYVKKNGNIFKFVEHNYYEDFANRDHYCNISPCIVVSPNKYGGSYAAIYQKKVSTFSAVVSSYRRGIAGLYRCGPYERVYENECAKKSFYDIGVGNSIRLPQNFWVNAADGVALSWELADVKSDRGKDSGNISMIEKFSRRAVPSSCADYDEISGGEVIPSACGVFRTTRIGGVYYQFYCLSQSFPGYESINQRCVPLYKYARNKWYVATVAGQILTDGAQGSTVDAGCFFDSKLSLRDQARIISRAFSKLVGGELKSLAATKDNFRFGITNLNVDLSRLAPQRPWGYVKLGISLNRTSTNSFSLFATFGYTVSSRRMSSRIDARETSEEEARKIGGEFEKLLSAALESISGEKVYCTSGF